MQRCSHALGGGGGWNILSFEVLHISSLKENNSQFRKLGHREHLSYIPTASVYDIPRREKGVKTWFDPTSI